MLSDTRPFGGGSIFLPEFPHISQVPACHIFRERQAFLENVRRFYRTLENGVRERTGPPPTLVDPSSASPPPYCRCASHTRIKIGVSKNWSILTTSPRALNENVVGLECRGDWGDPGGLGFFSSPSQSLASGHVLIGGAALRGLPAQLGRDGGGAAGDARTAPSRRARRAGAPPSRARGAGRPLHSPRSKYGLSSSMMALITSCPQTPVAASFVVRAPAQHGLSSKKTALITSDHGIMCYLRIKWP